MHRRALLIFAVLAAALPSVAPAAGGGGGGEKKKGGGSGYIQLPTTNVSIVRRDGRRGVMSVGAGVEAPDPKMRELARASRPRLRAAFAQTLQVYAGGLPSNQAPDAEYLSESLQRDTDRVIGRPGAKLLLGAIMIN